MEKGEEKENVLVKIIAIMGAVLIFVGIAWLIAKNWHQIPDVVKTLILVFSTLLTFGIGVFIRSKDHEGIGRALLVLGAGLYLLSLFLISQIYHLATTPQHYAWLLLLGWIVIMLTAYLLKSPENLLISLVLFFPWVTTQYFVGIEKLINSNEGGIILGVVLIYLCAGVLLYSLSIFHNSIKHKFTGIYRFWTVFYFLAVFYVLSFQMALPVLGNYSFESGAFPIFLISFIIISFFAFVLSILFASSKKVISIKEILIFIGIIAAIFLLILAIKPLAGGMGDCIPKTCYDLKTTSECNSAPSQLDCDWIESDGGNDQCREASCYNYQEESECNSASSSLNCDWVNNDCREIRCYDYRNNESGCNSAPSSLNCTWRDFENNQGNCEGFDLRVVGERDSLYEECDKHDNQKESCLDDNLCRWRISSSLGFEGKLPIGLWFLWTIINILFIGFIILILGYGQSIGSKDIINLGILVFILDVISRYIGFWIDLSGYIAFSFLSILGGILLIVGAWLIPKWRRSLIQESHHEQEAQGG